MQRCLKILTATAVVAGSFGLHAAAAEQQNREGMPWPPGVEFRATPASRIHVGMTTTEVAAVMGEATMTTSYINDGIPGQILDFASGPVPQQDQACER